MLLYRDEFESTEQIIDVNFAMVYVILHQEALLKALDLFNIISASFQLVLPIYCFTILLFLIPLKALNTILHKMQTD